MKIHPYAVVVAAVVTAAVNIAAIAPANAAATDPVTNLQVSQTQVGPNDHVTATWTGNGSATTYRAFITDNADGTSGAVLAFQDTNSSTATISTSTLAAGTTYWVAVKATQPSAGTVTTHSFVANALDTTAPNGTYSINRTSAYLAFDPHSDSLAKTAAFKITQSTLSDDTTPAGSIKRKVYRGDGSTGTTWPSGTTITLTYSQAGTFTPRVELTDQYGNLSVKFLPQIAVKEDTTSPIIRITTPANPTHLASWRVIRGTSSDTGTGVSVAATMVIEKRGRLWYAYDFDHKKWLKGYANMKKTLTRTKAQPATFRVGSNGAWHTPAIKSLRAGTLHVEAIALDGAFNLGRSPKITRVIS